MKKSFLTLLGIIVATVSLFANNPDHQLTIVVNNIESTEGILTVSLFDSEGNWLKSGQSQRVAVKTTPSVSLTFDGLPKGTYAVSVYHDKNSNDKLDTGAFGIPMEAYGFSNDARGLFGPADFDECTFEISDNKQIEINIK
ncbi:DUF2141 domain-containing protein [Reichenbachiella carrageenanivorans]|uniref:DUF2141 domain-containing protein n=1 Tax=Reichenbachiella carrageenanivorans TaxID=2979869 RepID=A0ABY6CZ10_9BACT|nr:DUF2141 domain-containing protein [Reichenbachiella carrageenanivorans]UXX79152.1 DUF2141 domain-containing protein [Reichenbachiella carrageenanivorans]